MKQLASRVLIIEDESGIAMALYKSLTQAAYQVATAKSGSSGIRKANAQKFDIILLDLGLPDMSGLTICRQLRADGLTAPIIVLTAEHDIHTKVTLFDAGANDYLTKPFSTDELKARIRSCLRQTMKSTPQPRLTAGDLTLNTATHSVERAGLLISLRPKEFAILEYLMLRPGTAVTRASLLDYAWQGEAEGWTNTIDVHIKHLRDKIDRPFAHSLIKTVHGVGYKLDLSSAIAKTS